MPERIVFPQWRSQNQTTRYPFAELSSLTNGTDLLLEGMLIDAVLYPIGGQERMRLSQVIITHDTVTLYIGDQVNDQLASGSFALVSPPNSVSLADAYGRPAGLLIAESLLLGLLATWGTGTHVFNAAATEFSAAVCIPTPEIGVRGVLLDDGSILTGDLWLVGADGVVLTRVVPETDGVEVIRVDVVGDPLFRRRLCGDPDLFTTPQFVRTITFADARQTIAVSPDAAGNIEFSVNNDLAADTVLRIHPTAAGNKIEVVGSVTQD